MPFMKSHGNATDKTMSNEEQKAKIDEVRKTTGPIVDKFPALFSDASISRYLRARNWNVKKAAKMLKETLKWRLQYKPEKIRWEDIAREAETGKVYRAKYTDKYGRSVLVMRPGFQNTKEGSGQIKYLVYCLENAIMNLSSDQEQMVWLIDFQGWNSSKISVKVTHETANILQNHYPERLGIGILYNPPKLFESFWTIVKPFLEPKTFKKVKFVYSNNPQSQKIMEELFDMDKLETSFGGKNTIGFDYETYRQTMKEDDQKCINFVGSSCSSPSSQLLASDGASASSDEGGAVLPNDNIGSSNFKGIGDKILEDSDSGRDVA